MAERDGSPENISVEPASFQFVPRGRESVPSNEPEVVPFVGPLGKDQRSTTNCPVAPANRPVPPVTVKVSTMKNTPGVS